MPAARSLHMSSTEILPTMAMRTPIALGWLPHRCQSAEKRNKPNENPDLSRALQAKRLVFELDQQKEHTSNE
jgi:hypothetical protein